MVSASSNHPATGSALTGGLSMTTSATWPRTSDRITPSSVVEGLSDTFGAMTDTTSTNGPLDYTGKVVIVTGGCRGIGRTITERFLGAGADVVICCRNEPETPPAAGGREAVFVAADVRDPDEIDQVVQFTVERFGRIDVLINNAGGAPPSDDATVSPRFSASIITLNLVAPIVFAQRGQRGHAGPGRGRRRSSTSRASAGTRPAPGTVAYGAAKAGLIHATGTLADSFAPKVRVVCATVGLVRTEQAHLFYGDEAGIAAVGATIPMGRMVEPSDVADACLFLASPLAGFVSGAELRVDGGGERPAYLEASTADMPGK